MKYSKLDLLLEASLNIDGNTKRIIFLKNKTIRHNYLFNYKLKKYICIDCNKYYSEKKNLKYHIESKHLGIKYKCNLCNFKTSRKYYLKCHIIKKH